MNNSKVALTSTLVLALLLSVGILTVAEETAIKDKYWNNLPEAWKVNLTTYNALDEPQLQISGYFLTEKVAKKAWGVEWSKKDAFSKFINYLKSKYPNRTPLMIYVKTYTSSYFFPGNFAFTQGNTQYNVSRYKDVIKISETFSGKLRKWVVQMGVILIPKGVNLDKPFKLWYGDHSKKMGAYNLNIY